MRINLHTNLNHFFLVLVTFTAMSTGIIAGENAGKNIFINKITGESIKSNFFIHSTLAKGTKFKTENTTLIATIPEMAKKVSYAIQIFFHVSLEQDSKYRLSFMADSNKEGDVPVKYLLNTSPYTPFSSNVILIKSGKNSYETILEPKAVKGKFDPKSSIRFLLGNFSDASVAFSNIQLEKM